jgi:hypothetical protein
LDGVGEGRSALGQTASWESALQFWVGDGRGADNDFGARLNSAARAAVRGDQL